MDRAKKLRELLAGERIIMAPGAYDAWSARLVEKAGFPAVYMTGYGVSASVLGRPDIGLISFREMADMARNICACTEVPVIADADNGYGGALNVVRTVQEYEQAGVAGIQLEDQVMPKRCGHMEGKQVIPKEEMAAKIRAAAYARKNPNTVLIARTDAIAVNGYEDAIDRAAAYREAGADVIFVEALQTREQAAGASQLVGAPLFANMVEHGKTPLDTAEHLYQMGFRIAIYPVVTLYAATKAIGEVPRAELNGLWQNYHFLIEQFFNKVKINKELILLDQKKNLESKTLLCEKAEELIVEPSIAKAAKELQNLREQWREIGPVPVEHNDEIWARFRNAASQIDERRREHYEQRREEMEKNLLAKQALIEKAQELTAEKPTATKQWNEVSAQLDELLKVWKSIGPVPREQNEEIWNTFKGSIDRFYAEKKQHFDTVKDEQSENYNKKIDLCLQAEAIAKRDDWKKATEELLKLQDEWKHIGPVSRKVSEKIWQRFRGACDEFFNRKSAYFTELRGSEQENLAKKEAILTELKAFAFGDDKEENLTAIKDFQRRWMEVGFVPIADKQRLQKEFRDTINAMFEKLKITAREAELNSFRETLHSNASGDHGNKKNQLMEQIQKLRSDISLWENNLGFLANSKQADLLKAEFEKKMQSARQEIALLEAKLKILNTEEAGQTEAAKEN